MALACIVHAGEVTITVDPQSGPANFAAGEVEAALKARGETIRRLTNGETLGTRAIVLAEALNGRIVEEGFALSRVERDGALMIVVGGGGSGGVMYGGLELAEQIRIGGLDAVQPIERMPHFPLRGAKFNLPLDVRTPSYTDMSDAAQNNIATVWDFSFWTAYLDALARARFNFVSLWNLHPFPSLVKVPGYEDIALDDVQRSTVKFAENYSTRVEDISTPAMLAHVETVRKMTIEEKIEFWRNVIRYAKDRNIDFYIVTWNTYTFGTGGKHGITDALDNPATIDYFRKSVAELFRTYPLLRGIGVTAGENMGQAGASFQAKEDWLFATYGQGVIDAARERPARPIRFIHRQHETKAQDIAQTFAPLRAQPNVEFDFSFKYAQAHALSSTTQPFAGDFVKSLGGIKTFWTLRNDDALMFRWGAPDFVREFIKNIPRDVTAGVYYGSDMWVWGREFLSREPASPRQLEIEKHWLDWTLWGRLSYDPTLANERVAALIAQRFPGVDGAALLEAWQNASMVYPLTTGFHWGAMDFQWYIEACKSRPGPAQTASGFHDVNRFITLGTHPGTDTVPIPGYIDAMAAGDKVRGTMPTHLASNLDRHADSALAAVDRMDAGPNQELRETLGDVRAMALLGKYYAAKIRGATELALFRKTGWARAQQAAVTELTQAAEYWEQYTTLAASQYRNPL
ncbi:MAG TPA: carbohydrate-binding family 6 protein, partial [Candidatus Didemnitutus sp.]|nr:carbohydrate-binding family 6 protein [Candidatus Didemnitutus sp.]